jgi:hypothetical protein
MTKCHGPIARGRLLLTPYTNRSAFSARVDTVRKTSTRSEMIVSEAVAVDPVQRRLSYGCKKKRTLQRMRRREERSKEPIPHCSGMYVLRREMLPSGYLPVIYQSNAGPLCGWFREYRQEDYWLVLWYTVTILCALKADRATG